MAEKDKKNEETREEESTQPGMSTQPLPSKPARQRRGVGHILLRIFLWLVVLVLGFGCGVAGYILLPPLYEQTIAPIQANTADIAELETRMAELDVQLAELESQQASSVVEQDEALVDFQAEMVDRSAELEMRLAESEARLNDAEREQGDLEDQLDDLLTGLDIQADALEVLEARLTTLEEEIPGADEMHELNRQLLLMRAWQEILKARVRLVQNNAGAAYEELLIAQASLELAYDVSQAEHQAELEPIMARLADVLVELETNPFAATEDLEIVWHDLDRLINPEVRLPEVFEEQPAGELEEGAIEATPTPTPTPIP
jgi:DNA repair exonuclease SbcCD ATPase subunit